jgi:hypothetical protein
MTKIKSVNSRFTIEIFCRRATDNDCLGFLYRCGFVSAREQLNDTDYVHRDYEEYPSLVDARVGIEKFEWEIHPAFRYHLKGLQVAKPLLRLSKK